MRLDFPRAILALLVATACSAASPPRLVRSLPDGGEPPDDGSLPVDGAPVDVPVHIPGNPGVGGHALAFYGVGQNAGLLTTPAITTQPSGSTIVVGVARGNIANFTSIPSDNKGNSPYQLQGTTHPYAHPDEGSGTAVYAYVNARGGSGFQVSDLAGYQPNNQLDEITMFAVEVVEGSTIHDVKWNEVASGPPTSTVTSASVTTTGPATLIAFWWGISDSLQSVAPDGSFSRLDPQLDANNHIQGVVAVRNTADAGTYSVTWTASPAQGAELWLIAVQ